MSYQLSNNGLRALNNNQFKDASPDFHRALEEIDQLKNSGGILSKSTQDIAQVLLEIGLINKQVISNSIVTLNKKRDQVSLIKSSFVKLLKTDFHQDENLWDMLLNIESADDKDGLLWFMNRIITYTPQPMRDNYKDLFQQLMELEDE